VQSVIVKHITEDTATYPSKIVTRRKAACTRNIPWRWSRM